MNAANRTRVLVVDDSTVVRAMLMRVLQEQPDIEVIGGAKDAFEARDLVLSHAPDVIILDVEMPRVDGLTFLKKLMAQHPLPVIICSGITASSSSIALEAIECGAVDVVAKPTKGGTQALRRLGEVLADKIRAAAIAGTRRPARPAVQPVATGSLRAMGIDPDRWLVAIGASTGGTEALKNLLEVVPADFPPVVMVQHMPEGFTDSFAKRLNVYSALEVSEAIDGEYVASGKAVLARGGIQMSVSKIGPRWKVSYGTSEPVNRHCPAVDVLFDSAAACAKAGAVGILLTGMGADGAQGLLRMRKAGAMTVGQNEQSCVVYGMPKAAADIGAVQETGAPHEIPNIVARMLAKASKPRGKAIAGAR